MSIWIWPVVSALYQPSMNHGWWLVLRTAAWAPGRGVPSGLSTWILGKVVWVGGVFAIVGKVMSRVRGRSIRCFIVGSGFEVFELVVRGAEIVDETTVFFVKSGR